MAVLLTESLRNHLEVLLGSAVRAVATVAGGDINDAYRIGLADGRRLFVKTNRNAPPGLYAREAEGLAYLREGLRSSVLRVPDVVAQSELVLVLEYLEFAQASADVEEALGQGLAQLHSTSPGQLGLDRDNYVGRLVQANQPLDSWPEFYGERRLLGQARLPQAERLLGQQLRRRLERLVAQLGDRLPNTEPPARLHGDLWGGNWLPTAQGPYLVDPAVYGGHREVDLAMMSLFGGFSERTFAAYQEALPLLPGFAERVPIYQLYPLLVHVNSFGEAYVEGVRRILTEYG